MENNTKFETLDIALAAFLSVKDIKLLDIVPEKSFQSRFIFEKPPQELLDDWLTGEAAAGVKQVINAYRHLVRLSRQRQATLEEVRQ